MRIRSKSASSVCVIRGAVNKWRRRVSEREKTTSVGGEVAGGVTGLSAEIHVGSRLEKHRRALLEPFRSKRG
jgi:hypothetical protein